MVDKLIRVARIGEHVVRISFFKGRIWNEKRHRGERIILKSYVSEISVRWTIKMVDTPLCIYFLDVITSTKIYNYTMLSVTMVINATKLHTFIQSMLRAQS
jgi:hypothetical protein